MVDRGVPNTSLGPLDLSRIFSLTRLGENGFRYSLGIWSAARQSEKRMGTRFRWHTDFWEIRPCPEKLLFIAHWAQWSFSHFARKRRENGRWA